MSVQKNKENQRTQAYTASRESFIQWGKKNHHLINSCVPTNDNGDLKSFINAVGDAKVVVLSEGFHNCKEMMQLHERLIRYLVEHKGFNTVMTESSFPESNLVYNYLQGKKVEGDIYEQGFNKMYSDWVEGRSLVDWMYDYNKKNDYVLEYYGADIGGFYKSWYPGVNLIKAYFDKVEPEYTKIITAQLEPLLQIMGEQQARINYLKKLTAIQKAKLGLVFEEIIQKFDQNEQQYIQETDIKSYQWARQSAISMRMAENYYRNYENKNKQEPHLYAGLDGRELMMANNVLWALQQREDAKIILINHVVHTKTQSQLQDGPWGNFTPMAEFIKDKIGDDLFVTGMCYGGGEFWDEWTVADKRQIAEIPPIKDDGLEAVMQEISKKDYFINWSNADPNSWYWLDHETSVRENDYYMKINPIEWDACFYLSKVSPATEYKD